MRFSRRNSGGSSADGFAGGASFDPAARRRRYSCTACHAVANEHEAFLATSAMDRSGARSSEQVLELRKVPAFALAAR